jgi:hypothetical protein
MAEQSFPFENIDTTESQFSEWATNFQETGVQGSPTGTELGITVTGSDLNLTVAAGQAFIRGHYYINTSDLVLAVTSAGVNTRIDIVVVELDPEANTIVTKIVSGEAVSADPVAPTLTQSATGIYQLPIATLTIPASTVAITAGMLVDTRTFMGNRIGIWTTATRPTNPTAYQTLGYNTTIESHESWNGTAWVGFFDPITTEGDLVVGDGTGQASRLGVGDDDQVLTVVSGVPAWADGGGGGNYYNITAGGTYTVSLDAGLYGYASTGEVTVGGVSLNGVGLANYASTITQIVALGGITYTSRTSGFGTTDINDVTYGDGLYVAVGSSGKLTTSPDGTTWTTRTSGFGATTINDVTYGDGLYVAVGSSGKLTTSPDGITWTTRTSGFGATTIYGVTHGDGLYVAVGNSGTLTTSTDGTTWTTRTSGFGATGIYDVTYGGGLYVAVGSSGTLTTSPDGTTWTTRTSGFGTSVIFGVTYGNGLYVAVSGYSTRLATSPDGITWTTRTSGFGTTVIYGVTYGGGLYVAVGSSGTLTTSPDGITWTTRTSGFATNDIYGVGYGDGLYVAGGASGTLTTSPSFSQTFLALEPKSPVTNLPA